MKFSSLVIFIFLLCNYARTQNLSLIKSKIDSVYTHPSADLLPPELNSSVLENEYYCDPDLQKGHVSVLRLRNNHACIYETYYKPYQWTRITFLIGNYCISGDTIYITYKPLIKGKPDAIYVSPEFPVSWVTPPAPKYLLLIKNKLFDPYQQRHFHSLTDKPQFDLESR